MGNGLSIAQTIDQTLGRARARPGVWPIITSILIHADEDDLMIYAAFDGLTK